jgi:hypothetical protein
MGCVKQTLEERMQGLHTRFAKVLAIAAAVAIVGAVQLSRDAAGQSGEGWTVLFDGKSLDGWNKVGGDTNWRLEDGAVVADKIAGKDAAFLVSKNAYKDFMLHIEFWASDDSNSGIYMRCQDPNKLTDRSCYEANIFDQRKDPTYGTGGIVHFVEVNPLP